jgi:hypothetical protein
MAELGYELDGLNGSGHARFSHPTGVIAHAALTPSDRNANRAALRFARAQLRAAGVTE